MLLHADNFSIYGSNTGLLVNGVYAEADCQLIEDPDGLSPGRVMDFRGTNQNVTTPFRYVLQNGAVSVIGIAGRVWLTSLPENNSGARRLTVLNGGNDRLASVYFYSTGVAVVEIEGAGLYETPAPVISAQGWYHIELKYEADVALCSFELRIEGITVLAREDVPGPASLPRLPAQLGGRNSNTSDDSYHWLWKDFVVWDGGGSRNKDFLGSVLVATLTPTSDVALNWALTGGPNGYSILDNIPPSNSAYISAEDDPLPAPYVATLSNLPPEVTSVKGLISYVRAAKSDGGDGSLQTGIISDPTGVPETVQGANRPITVAQTYWRDVFETDPKTDGSWSPAAVNAAQLTINRTT